MTSILSIWNFINKVGAILGIFAAIISIWLFVKVDKIEELAQQAREWMINIEITDPRDGAVAEGVAVRVVGKLEFRTLASDTQSAPKVNLALAQNHVALVCYLRPISTNATWYLQYEPIISQNGDFDCLVFPEHGQENQITIDHQIVVLAVPEGQLPEGNRHLNLPFYYAPSNIVIIKASH